MSSRLPLADQVAHVYVAVQQLQYGRSSIALAEELGISRFAVGRMVRRARAEGLVDVVARLPQPIDPGLSRKLAHTCNLRAAYAVHPPRWTDAHVRRTIAEVAAQVLMEVVPDDGLVGLGPGRTIVEMTKHLAGMPRCDIVQLTGVVSEEHWSHVRALMALTEISGGRVFLLPAPFLVTDQPSKRVIVAQPAVRDALKRMDHLDVSVLTIGGWPGSSLLADQVLSQETMDPGATYEKVCGEIGTTIFDAEGKRLDTLDDRMIGITSEQMLHVPLRVALGGGPEKRDAVWGALRAGLIDILVTDTSTAHHVLSQAG